PPWCRPRSRRCCSRGRSRGTASAPGSRRTGRAPSARPRRRLVGASRGRRSRGRRRGTPPRTSPAGGAAARRGEAASCGVVSVRGGGGLARPGLVVDGAPVGVGTRPRVAADPARLVREEPVDGGEVALAGAHPGRRAAGRGAGRV